MPTPGVTTLATVRLQAQQRSDLVGAATVTTAEWNGYINASYQELYGLLVQAYGADYFVQTPSSGYTFTTDGTNDHFALPSDFFKLLGVDLQVSAPNSWVTLKPFAFGERNRYSMANTNVPPSGQTVKVLYAPRLTLLSADADTLDGINGWEEYIVVDAAAKALLKEESDVSVHLAIKGSLEKRLEAESANRDAGSPATVVDSQRRRPQGMQYRLNGSNLWLIQGGLPSWGGLDEGGWL